MFLLARLIKATVLCTLEYYSSTKFSTSSTIVHRFVELSGTVALNERASRKKSIFIQTLKVGANDRSAQELQKLAIERGSY